MKTAIVTDSNAGITAAEAKAANVIVIPMPVMIEDKIYHEGIDISTTQFCEALMQHKPVHTSQPSPGEVTTAWETAFAQGYDDLVYIPMSSGLSGSCDTARSFADDYDGKVWVADDHRISVTLRHAVEDAVILRNRGMNAREIKEQLEKNALHSKVYVGVATLDYLKASGRVTAAAAAIGSLLNIHPLLVIQGGKLDAYAKVRGTISCQMKLIQAIKKELDLYKEAGVPYKIGVAGSFYEPEEQQKWIDMVHRSFPDEEIHYDPLTISISAHTGENAFGMGISQVEEDA